MNLTESQQKRALKLAEFSKGKTPEELTKDLPILKNFLELFDKLDEQNDKLEMLNEIKDAITSIEIPEQKDEQANFDAILEKLNEEDTIEISLNII